MLLENNYFILYCWKIIIFWWLFIASQFPFDYIAYKHGTKRGRVPKNSEKGTKELDRLKCLSTKIQEVTSNVVITGKNEKQYVYN